MKMLAKVVFADLLSYPLFIDSVWELHEGEETKNEVILALVRATYVDLFAFHSSLTFSTLQ